MDSDQKTENKTTGAASVLHGARARVTSIQGRGEAGSVLSLHDVSDASDAASGNLKAIYRYETEGLEVYVPGSGILFENGLCATLSFDCAGSDVFATGSVIESRGSSEVTFDTSAAGETLLTFTPANAATNLFTTGSMIDFICYEDGTYHIASKMGGAADATTGAFVFAS